MTTESGMELTPAEWILQFEQMSYTEKFISAEKLLANANDAEECFIQNHKGQIHALSQEIFAMRQKEAEQDSPPVVHKRANYSREVAELPRPPESDDAMKWAEVFVQYVELIPHIATDPSTMVGWFANAMYAAERGHERRQPQAGDRTEDGGQMGTLIRCPMCSGDGLLHKLDQAEMDKMRATQPQEEIENPYIVDGDTAGAHEPLELERGIDPSDSVPDGYIRCPWCKGFGCQHCAQSGLKAVIHVDLPEENN